MSFSTSSRPVFFSARAARAYGNIMDEGVKKASRYISVCGFEGSRNARGGFRMVLYGGKFGERGERSEDCG